MWTYNVSTGSFSNITVGGTENVPSPGSYGGYVSNPATGHSYYIGYPVSGYFGNRKRDVTAPWLQVLDSSTSDVQWLAGAGNGPAMTAGQMVYVRAGAEGVLIGFGGTDPLSHKQFAESGLADYYSMDQIFVFDIASSTW